MTADRFSESRGNRRQFLESSAGVAAGMVTLRARCSPNSELGIGVIGVRSRGRQIARKLAEQPGVRIRALCDVDAAQLPRAAAELEQTRKQRPRRVRDFRQVLDAPDVDAVVVATPDHWHAVMTSLACQAGKDVLLETPVSHTITDSQSLLTTIASTDRIVMAGLQQRWMPHVQSALAAVHEGRIGVVRLARAWTSHRRKPIGRTADRGTPADVDYDLWLGPAPERPFNPNRFHYAWRWFWDYGGGELTNWGIHMIDLARLGLGVERPQRVSATGGLYHFRDDQETPDTLTVNYDFGDRTLVWEHRQWCPRGIEGRSAGVAFYGDKGSLIVDRGGWKIYDSDHAVSSAESGSGDALIPGFVDALHSRSIDSADFESAVASADLCHLGNIAWRLGREINSFAGGIPQGGSEVAALLGHRGRGAWVLPEA